MALVDRTQEAALLRRKWMWIDKLWLGWKYFLYFFCPPSGMNEEPCIYCWLTRVFVVGLVFGGTAIYWIMRLT